MTQLIPPILLDYCSEFSLTKGEFVYSAGEPAHGFYYVKSGLIGLYHTSSNGKDSLLRLYKEGCYFGYRTLFSQQHYYATTRAMLPSILYHISVSSLPQLQGKAPELVNYFLTGVCQELGEAETRLANTGAYKVKVRILDAILYLFNEFPHYNWTYREIGEYCGTETGTVIRLCKQLKQQDLLDKTSRRLKPVSLTELNRYRTLLDSIL